MLEDISTNQLIEYMESYIQEEEKKSFFGHHLAALHEEIIGKTPTCGEMLLHIVKKIKVLEDDKARPKTVL